MDEAGKDLRNRTPIPDTLPTIGGLKMTLTRTDHPLTNQGMEILPLSDDETAFLFFQVHPDEPAGRPFSAMCKMAFRFCLKPECKPGEVLSQVNRLLFDHIAPLHYLTAFLAILDHRTHHLRFANAGHSPLSFRSSRHPSPTVNLLAEGVPCAIFNAATYPENKIQMPEATVLFMTLQKAYTFTCQLTEPPRQQAWLSLCGLPPDGHYDIKTLRDFDDMMAFLKDRVDYLDRMGCTIKFLKNFRLVILELVTNAILHGNRGDTSKRVITVFETTADHILFGVIDEGEGYDEKQLPDPLCPTNLTRQQGRGVFLVKHYTDEFRLCGNGNCTVIKFDRHNPKHSRG
ncbi:MAG: hypothetical protein A2293_02290 [Elusimicrobia bacterium RIFOXYB2_FULL_49_7]|nr:MAG: hypothetical protein A2293_02290 [Elusimicrobia bacterium RIFOXYB2_FULL_49_7]